MQKSIQILVDHFWTSSRIGITKSMQLSLRKRSLIKTKTKPNIGKISHWIINCFLHFHISNTELF